MQRQSHTVKILKLGHLKSHRYCPKNGTIWLNNAVITLKDATGMANSVGIDQTALLRASDLCLHCLL
ncbi:MAG: hypothetical protein AB2693_26620, partial [Candidatus Thiodiazotropha sp.]